MWYEVSYQYYFWLLLVDKRVFLTIKSTEKDDKNKSVIVTTNNNSFFCVNQNGTLSPTNLDEDETTTLELKASAAEMLTKIHELEKTITTTEGKAKLYSFLKECFEEIVKSDPIYGKLLEKIKLSHDSERTLAESNLQKEKHRGDKLEKENIELTKEYEKQCTLIDSQKILIRELKKQTSNGTTAAGVENSQKMENLMNEIKTLYKENSRLEAALKKATSELKQYKDKEKAMVATPAVVVQTLPATKFKENESEFVKKPILTESAEWFNKSKVREKSATTTLAKTKPKVVVPKLDFSKLPQKKQAVVKVVQCEPSSATSSLEQDAENIDDKGTVL